MKLDIELNVSDNEAFVIMIILAWITAISVLIMVKGC